MQCIKVNKNELPFWPYDSFREIGVYVYRYINIFLQCNDVCRKTVVFCHNSIHLEFVVNYMVSTQYAPPTKDLGEMKELNY